MITGEVGEESVAPKGRRFPKVVVEEAFSDASMRPPFGEGEEAAEEGRVDLLPKGD